MKFFIPQLKTELELTEDWRIKLDHGSENFDLWEITKGHAPDCKHWYIECGAKTNTTSSVRSTALVSIPAGSHVVVDKIDLERDVSKNDQSRVYLRLIRSDILFVGKKTVKFAVCLEDFNRIEAEIVAQSLMAKKPLAQGKPVSKAEFRKRIETFCNSSFWVRGKVGVTPINEVVCCSPTVKQHWNVALRDLPAGTPFDLEIRTDSYSSSCDIENFYSSSCNIENFDFSKVTGGASAEVKGTIRGTANDRDYDLKFFRILNR